MKIKVIFFLPFRLLIVFVLLFSGCSSCTTKTDNTPCLDVLCFASSFSENYLKNFDNKNVYYIKGIAMDKIDYGRKIKLIEDLKGNFPENVETFIAWGDAACMAIIRPDELWLYDKQDTLLMLLSPADRSHAANFAACCPKQNFPEKNGDYTTITCSYSVLRLTNDGNVTGFISPYKEGIGMIEETMSWEELQELLKEQKRMILTK
jgi:hypothetical protein